VDHAGLLPASMQQVNGPSRVSGTHTRKPGLVLGDLVDGVECVGHGRVDLEGSVDSGDAEHASDRPVARHTDDAEVAVDALVVALGGDDDGQPCAARKLTSQRSNSR
jgi:hypothetical protein